MADEYFTVYCHDATKARKHHTCCECRGGILKDEIYHVEHGIFDGGPFRYKTCKECYELRSRMNNRHSSLEDLVSITGLYEYVFEGGNLDDVRAYLLNKEKRGAVIPRWMTDRYDELANKDVDEEEKEE